MHLFALLRGYVVEGNCPFLAMVDCPNFGREKLHKLREQDAERIKETLFCEMGTLQPSFPGLSFCGLMGYCSRLILVVNFRLMGVDFFS